MWRYRTLGDGPGMKGRRELLDSIPGLGGRTVAILLAFGADPGYFRDGLIDIIKNRFSEYALEKKPAITKNSYNINRLQRQKNNTY